MWFTLLIHKKCLSLDRIWNSQFEPVQVDKCVSGFELEISLQIKWMVVVQRLDNPQNLFFKYLSLYLIGFARARAICGRRRWIVATIRKCRLSVPRYIHPYIIGFRSGNSPRKKMSRRFMCHEFCNLIEIHFNKEICDYSTIGLTLDTTLASLSCQLTGSRGN